MVMRGTCLLARNFLRLSLNLRPKLVQQLLEACSSVKVKRLFLYMADIPRAQWLVYVMHENPAKHAALVKALKGHWQVNFLILEILPVCHYLSQVAGSCGHHMRLHAK
jgi:hypothetical protein